MTNVMFDLLLQLPIFQGLSYGQLTEIVEKIPFDFARFNAGDVLYESGDRCEKITFLLNGTVRLTTPTFSDKVQITQDFVGPYLMPFYHLFGVQTTERSTLEAVTAIGVLHFDKENFLRMLQANYVMLVNVMNILSTHAQRQHTLLEFSGQAEPTLRLASWLLGFTDRMGDNITIEAKVTDWCNMLQMDQSAFWRSISQLEDVHCVEVAGGKLKLTDRYGLKGYVSGKTALD